MRQEETIIVPTVADFEVVANRVLAMGVKKILVFGEMGAGKTTFTKAFCQVLGVESAAQSPTYSVVNDYFFSKNSQLPSFGETDGGQDTGGVHHLDLYRLKNLEEALDIGIEDILEDNWFCLIEWAQVILPFLAHYYSDDEILALEIAPLEGEELKDFYTKNKTFLQKNNVQPRKVVILPSFKVKI